jgi:uncharacterized protein
LDSRFAALLEYLTARNRSGISACAGAVLGRRKDGMTAFTTTILIFLCSLVAGLLGSLTGLGGGVIIVPVLALLFGVNIRYAVGASLVSVIATSSGAAAAYVKEGFSNIRIGMFLEMATTAGAVSGALLAAHVSSAAIAVIFGVMLLASAYLSSRPQPEHFPRTGTNRLAEKLKMTGTYPLGEVPEEYEARAIPFGLGVSYLAGIMSGLLGIGGGALKVLAMDQVMRIPFKVSTATSNFMIGVTAAASAGIYLRRGYIDPALAMPVMLGVLAGSMAGSRALPGAKTRALRILFSAVIVVLAFEMIYKGVTGSL